MCWFGAVGQIFLWKSAMLCEACVCVCVALVVDWIETLNTSLCMLGELYLSVMLCGEPFYCLVVSKRFAALLSFKMSLFMSLKLYNFEPFCWSCCALTFKTCNQSDISLCRLVKGEVPFNRFHVWCASWYFFNWGHSVRGLIHWSAHCFFFFFFFWICWDVPLVIVFSYEVFIYMICMFLHWFGCSSIYISRPFVFCVWFHVSACFPLSSSSLVSVFWFLSLSLWIKQGKPFPLFHSCICWSWTFCLHFLMLHFSQMFGGKEIFSIIWLVAY